MPTKSLGPRRAAVLGKPVAHSLSPVLHEAAYRELGLVDWTYERIEVDAEALPGLVAGLGEEWVGLSVTMPGKRTALEVAAEATDRARAVGAANTLTRLVSGQWFADCTDVDGIVGALTVAGGYRPEPGHVPVVLGAGGTAAAAMVALAGLGVREARLVVRDAARAAPTLAAARRAELAVELIRWDEAEFAALADATSALISTVPSVALHGTEKALARAGCLLDVIYHPWPTPLAKAVEARGGRLATGLDMLLHQAFGQVELFTGRQAPRPVMREALRRATGDIVDLPL